MLCEMQKNFIRIVTQLYRFFLAAIAVSRGRLGKALLQTACPLLIAQVSIYLTVLCQLPPTCQNHQNHDSQLRQC